MSGDWKEVLESIISSLKPGPTDLDCSDRLLGTKDLKEIISSIQNAQLEVRRIFSCVPETIVAAAALGHQSNLVLKRVPGSKPQQGPSISPLV